MYGAIHYSDSLEGDVIGAAVGSGLGLVVGVKNAYDGFKADDNPWRPIRLIALESIHEKLYSPKPSTLGGDMQGASSA